MEILKSINLAVRFLLELRLLAALAYWGFQRAQPLPGKAVLSIGAPGITAIVWGVYLAPASSRRLHNPWLLFVELMLFGAATVALFSTRFRNGLSR